ncbi:MAG: tetratricopeptide repeat protein [Luteolibacter sp.]
MKPHPLMPSAASILLALVCSAGVLTAQVDTGSGEPRLVPVEECSDLTSLVEKSSAAMSAEKWSEALELNTQAVTRFGRNDPFKQYGAQFGALYFRKGICQMKLKKWSDAMQSFEVCYRDFPNHGVERENVFQKMALLKMGEVAMALEKWDLAVTQFRKFIEERDKMHDLFPHGTFYISMASCLYRLGDITQGNENLEIAINNKALFPTPESGIMAAFEALVTAVILNHKEQALLDFINKNRGGLIVESYIMHRYSSVFIKLAGDAIQADMQRTAMALYQLAPSTEVALDDARARLKDCVDPVEKSELEETVKELETALDGSNTPEMIQLAGLAFLHEKNGNIRGAFAAYQQLELYFPNALNREENLFNLVRTSYLIKEPERAREYAGKLIKDFPESFHVLELRRMME